MSSVVILQARTNSSRLPGKVLLPLGGYPLVVLAAKRAGNQGHKVIVATSDESTDDTLCEILDYHEIENFRGSLNNTLDRVVQALASFDDNTIVHRLTADNIFPDGILLDEIEKDFVARKLNYLTSTHKNSGLPYGVSVEVMRLHSLREANYGATSDYDREHVTPHIITQWGAQYFRGYEYLQKAHFRCTIDTFDDYMELQQVFADVENSVSVSFLDLISKLECLGNKPITHAGSKLVLGTAQFGLDYGITNLSGKVDREVVANIIKTAIRNGVRYLDTASAYGESEALIGNVLAQGWESRVKIITKLSTLDHCHEADADVNLKAQVESSVFKSCALLPGKKIDCLMLHRASHFSAFGGLIWQQLLDLKEQGYISELGVSVQSPEELYAVVDDPNVKYIQLPQNILDDRWDSVKKRLKENKKARHLTIHVRSVYLQGLLGSKDKSLWERANVDSPGEVVSWLTGLVAEFDRENIFDLCVAYLTSQDWIDGIVVGVESTNQLIENLEYFSRAPLNQEELAIIGDTRPKISEHTLNPSNWSL